MLILYCGIQIIARFDLILSKCDSSAKNEDSVIIYKVMYTTTRLK